MVALLDILQSINRIHYFSALDMAHAYFHICIHALHWKYFKFMTTGQHFQFKALKFRLALATQAFSKYLAPAAVHQHCP